MELPNSEVGGIDVEWVAEACMKAAKKWRKMSRKLKWSRRGRNKEAR